jgi:hypothetical protein
MAITVQLGGIRRNDSIFTTVIPISMLVDLTVPGMAFEAKEAQGEKFDHLDSRVQELYAARGTIQRAFFHRAMENVRVTDPDTGEKRTERKPTAWSPTRKYKNATGDLKKYIEGPFLDTPPLEATLPGFTIYFPEQLEGEEASFNARMGGEYHVYTLDAAKKAMEADGESRLLAIRLALADESNLSGSRREKLRSTLVAVDVIHGVAPAAMGQIFADLNGKGVTLTKNETEGLNIRDRWAKATKRIFDELNVPLVTTGRQVTAVNQAENKHLIIGQAVTMVRALGLPFNKAVSTTTHDEVLKDEADFERLVQAGVSWFGQILDHFGAETLPDGTRDARVFTDPDLVVRAMPIKVALGVMGNPWFEVNRPKQAEHVTALTEIDWRVSPAWQGIAGKVSPRVEKQKINGKTVRVPVDGEFALAASGAKELGAAAVRALANPESKDGRLVRNVASADPDTTSLAA